MSVTVQWDNEAKTVLRYDIAGRWTWEEFYAAFEQGKQMMNDITYPVDFILHPLDMVSQTYLPPNTITQTMALNRQRTHNAGRTVVVSQSPVARTMLTILAKISSLVGQNYVIVKTLDEAHTVLAAQEKEAD
jgi:hypothetical protein